MKTGYLYLIDGEVVVNPEVKPEPNIDVEDLAKIVSGEMSAEEYVKKALKDWQANCIPVVGNLTHYGTHIINRKDITGWFIQIGFVDYQIVSGQKCEHSVKNGKSTIISLI